MAEDRGSMLCAGFDGCNFKSNMMIHAAANEGVFG